MMTIWSFRTDTTDKSRRRRDVALKLRCEDLIAYGRHGLCLSCSHFRFGKAIVAVSVDLPVFDCRFNEGLSTLVALVWTPDWRRPWTRRILETVTDSMKRLRIHHSDQFVNSRRRWQGYGEEQCGQRWSGKAFQPSP